MLGLKRKVLYGFLAFLFVCTLVLVFLLVRNSSGIEEPMPSDIKIFVRNGTGLLLHGNAFLHITDDGVLETILFPRSFSERRETETLVDEIIFSGFIERGTIGENEVQRGIHAGERRLSQRQLNNIWTLADNVVPIRCWSDLESLEYPGYHVYALINGEYFWSLYSPDIHLTPERRPEWSHDTSKQSNESLLHLLYYLIDLSPVHMGFETHHPHNNSYSW